MTCRSFAVWFVALSLFVSPIVACEKERGGGGGSVQKQSEKDKKPSLMPTPSIIPRSITYEGLVKSGRVNDKPEVWEIQSGDEFIMDVEKKGPRGISFEKQKLASIEAFFRRNTSIPQVSAMKKFFGNNILVSLYSSKSGTSVHLADEAGKARVEKIMKADRHIEIVYYGAKDRKSDEWLSKSPSTHAYTKDWQAILVPAIKFPDIAWDDAFFGGVLYRAYHDLKNRGKEPTESEARAKNLEQRDVEIAILDRATRGVFLTAVRQQAPVLGPAMYDELACKRDLPVWQYGVLDSFFKPANGPEAGTRDMIYRVALAREMIRMQGDPKYFQKTYSGFLEMLSDPSGCV